MGNAFQSHKKIQLKLICNQPSERETLYRVPPPRRNGNHPPPEETSKIRSENLPDGDELTQAAAIRPVSVIGCNLRAKTNN